LLLSTRVLAPEPTVAMSSAAPVFTTSTNATAVFLGLTALNPKTNPFLLLDALYTTILTAKVPHYFTISNYGQLAVLGL